MDNIVFAGKRLKFVYFDTENNCSPFGYYRSTICGNNTTYCIQRVFQIATTAHFSIVALNDYCLSWGPTILLCDFVSWISEVFSIVVFFWIRNPTVGNDNRLMGHDNGPHYIVFFWGVGPHSFADLLYT